METGEKQNKGQERKKKKINQLVIDIIQAHTPAASSSKTEAGGIFKDFILKITPEKNKSKPEKHHVPQANKKSTEK